MTDPATLEEFNARANKNTRYTGQSPGNVTSHCPCPFCGAPDFMVFNVFDAEQVFEVGARCGECLRSMRANIKRKGDHSVVMEFVQTGGADPPPYLPKMRRVDMGPAPDKQT